MVEFTEREKFIIAVTTMNASEKASIFPAKVLGMALNELRKAHTPNIPQNEMQDYVDAVRKERMMIMADLMQALSKVK